jgi:hypothetical protein
MILTYDLFKDFAGPVAIVLAATVAASITWYFNRRQTQIAETQRDIAIDNLKVAVFEKRYEIYVAAKSLMETIAREQDFQKMDDAKIRSLHVTLDEARFFFPEQTRAFLEEISTTCERCISAKGRRSLLNPDDDSRWRTLSEEVTTLSLALDEMYRALPSKFEGALALKQLTNGR